MPTLDLPGPIDDFLQQPNPAVIACLRPDGFPMSVATWYEWRGGRILVNMDESRRRLGWMRSNPQVCLTVLGQDWYRHVSLWGLVVTIAEDVDLVDIDSLSRRYGGQPFGRRTAKRFSAWIEPTGWHAWDPTGELTRGGKGGGTGTGGGSGSGSGA
jgi:hypothetical protein